MTKLIRISEKDSASLEKVLRAAPVVTPKQPVSYKNRVVAKPWGYEFLVFENEHVAMWYLHLEKGAATSMHCHPKKKTALIVLAGQALCNTFYNRHYLYGVDGVVIEKGVFHSTSSLSPGGVELLEIETPPDKTDLVRLDDQYGRSGQGYEGLSEMKQEGLERYNYFSLESIQGARETSKQFENSEVSMVECREPARAKEVLAPLRGHFYCMCQGRVLDGSGNVVLDVGDATEGSFLSTFDELHYDTPALILRVRPIDAKK